MSAQKTAFIQRCLGLCLSLLVIVAPANPTHAIDGNDWVLVERFETQLNKATGGEIEAMYEVGRMYERGRGTSRDLDKAVEWYSAASEQGNNAAKARLGLMYLDGRGVNKDLKKARSMLTAASQAQIPTAQFHLAKMYEQGTGVQRNPEKAIELYKAAAEGGYYRAKNRVQELAEQQRRRERAKAKARARAQSKAQAESTPKPKPKAKAAKPDAGGSTSNTALVEALKSGNWIHNNRPAGYLPSSQTRCKRGEGETLKCQSLRQTRNTGFAVITYKTEAILSDFDSADHFKVRYYHNVLDAEATEANTATGLGEEDGATPTRVNVKLGKQDKEHHLQCELEDETTLTCTKDGLRTLSFHRQ